MLNLIVIVVTLLFVFGSCKRALSKITRTLAVAEPVKTFVGTPASVTGAKEILESGTGEPLYIGYNGAIISSADHSLIVVWTYQDEARFGDSWNAVSVNGTRLNGTMWGRGHCWSPCLQYLTFEEYLGAGSRLIVYSVERSAFFEVAKFSAATYFKYPNLFYGAYSNGEETVSEYVFLGDEQWSSR